MELFRLGSVQSGQVRSGPIVILRLTQSSYAGAGTELGKVAEVQDDKDVVEDSKDIADDQ